MFLLKSWCRLLNWMSAKKGQSMTEYALIIALVSIAAITVLQVMGTTLSGAFQKIIDTIKALL